MKFPRTDETYRPTEFWEWVRERNGKIVYYNNFYGMHGGLGVVFVDGKYIAVHEYEGDLTVLKITSSKKRAMKEILDLMKEQEKLEMG